MCEMEHVLNVYASKVCRDSVADFIGYCGVSREEAHKNLTPGTWLARHVSCFSIMRILFPQGVEISRRQDVGHLHEKKGHAQCFGRRSGGR